MKKVVIIVIGIVVVCCCIVAAVIGGSAILVANAGPTNDVPVSKMQARYLSTLGDFGGYREISGDEFNVASDSGIETKFYASATSSQSSRTDSNNFILVQTGEAILGPEDLVERIDNASCNNRVQTNVVNLNIREYKGRCGDRAFYFLERISDEKVIVFETVTEGEDGLQRFIDAYIAS